MNTLKDLDEARGLWRNGHNPDNHVNDDKLNLLFMPVVKVEHEELKVEDDIQKQLTPPTVKKEFVEVKEELNDTFLVEDEIWDGSEVKLDPKVEITIEETALELPKEVADCTLTDMLNSSCVVIQPKAGGGTSAAIHNTHTSPDSGIQLSLNVNPSSLPDCEIPSVHQYSRDTVKKRMCKKRMTSTIQNTGIQTRLDEIIKRKKPLLPREGFNTAQETLRCDTNKLFTCDTCHKCFRRLSHLKTHTGIHTGSKPYICDTCDKSFSQLGHLKIHIRVHTGSKPYICDSCHKCFSTLSSLKRHNRIHSGSKPYSCNTCHKWFTDLSTLKKHSYSNTHRENTLQML